MLSFPETLDLSEFSGNGIPGKNVIAQNLKKLPGNGNRALCMAESPLCRNIRKCLQITYASLLQNLQILSGLL